MSSQAVEAKIETFFIPRESSRLDTVVEFLKHIMALLEDQYGLSPVAEIIRLIHPELNTDYLAVTLYVDVECRSEIAKDVGIECPEGQTFRLMLARIDMIGEEYPVHIYRIGNNKIVNIVYREMLNKLKIYVRA